MVLLNVLTCVTLAALAAAASDEEPGMVWPKNKVNVTDSYLPAVVQVLTFLMEDLYDLVPPSEPSDTSSSTTTTDSTTATSETSSATTDTTELPEATGSSASVGDATTGASPATEAPEATSSSATSESPVTTANSESTASSASQTEKPTTESQNSPSEASSMDESSTASSSHTPETLTQAVIEEENQESDDHTTTSEAPYVRPSLAYVMLGRLRDILANEAKRQGFSKIQGFSAEVIETLQRSSYGGSASQLRGLLCSMLSNNDIKRKDSLSHSKSVLALLEDPSSFLVKILESVPPLNYTVYK